MVMMLDKILVNISKSGHKDAQYANTEKPRLDVKLTFKISLTGKGTLFYELCYFFKVDGNFMMARNERIKENALGLKLK